MGEENTTTDAGAIVVNVYSSLSSSSSSIDEPTTTGSCLTLSSSISSPSSSSPSPSLPANDFKTIFYIFIRKTILLLIIVYCAMCPLLLPFNPPSKDNLSQNLPIMFILAFMSSWLWAYTIVFAHLDVGPSPIPKIILQIHHKLNIPDCLLRLYSYWICPVVGLVTVIFSILIPTAFKVFPIPFWMLAVGAITGVPMNFYVSKIMYPKSVRTEEVQKKLARVAKCLIIPIVYSLIGIAFLCGFYKTSALSQLSLVFIINLISFGFRVILRRTLKKLDVVHFEGPILYYIFNLSQLLTLQSLPNTTGSLIPKVMSGLYPLINWKKIFRSNRIDVLPSNGIPINRRSTISLFLFPLEEKEYERDALTCFVILFSAVSSTLSFLPIYTIMYMGKPAKYFVYHNSNFSSSIYRGYAFFPLYMAAIVAIAVSTFLIANYYFKKYHNVSCFEIGVLDLQRNFSAYLCDSMYALVLFVILNLQHSGIIYYVASELYGSKIRFFRQFEISNNF